jgi:DNA (cytosine-5)-methyltransferase 3A
MKNERSNNIFLSEGINVLSLFDGMSCGQIALDKLGIKVNNYFASEIDKYAIQVTKHNYPNTKHIGDVTKVKGADLPKIDLLIGGSPCQGFSFAGKQLNFEDPRSKLFFEFVRLLEETKPKYFLLENVRMKKSSQDIISNYLGCEPIEINSNLVSAQSRRRLYWTNIPNIEQPKDKGILLQDVVVDGGIDCRMTTQDKAYALTASYNGAVAWNSIEKKQRTMILEAVNGKKVHIDLFKEAPYSFYETRTEAGKEARRRIRLETGKDSTPRSKEFKMYLPLKDQKANCLVTVESPLDFIVDKAWKYRKLYPIEMERLQTVPDGYTSIVSDTQARKMLGNGWTVDVIAHIFNQMAAQADKERGEEKNIITDYMDEPSFKTGT